MTQAEINALGIAFFSGKILQYKPPGDPGWWDWNDVNCPSFLRDSWRQIAAVNVEKDEK